MKNSSGSRYPIVDLIKEGVDVLVEGSELLIKNGQGGFEDFINKKSTELDEYIVEKEKFDGLSYAAGDVSLILADNGDEFYLEADFYFKDKNGGWVKKNIKGRAIKLEWALTLECQQVLKGQKKIVFDYVKPEA